jgi:hypothetical protein
MLGSSIALVLRETVVRVKRISLGHQAIASDFGDHARSRDAEAEGVSADHCGLRDGEGMHGKAVDQNVIGRRGEERNGLAHGLVGGAQDIEAVDFFRFEDCHAPADVSALHELRVKVLAHFFGELLGVVQSPEAELLRQDHRRGDDRASEWAASGFINSRYKAQTSRTKTGLVREVARHAGKKLWGSRALARTRRP